MYLDLCNVRPILEGDFSALDHLYMKKVQCWKGKRVILAYHIFKTPVERPKVGNKEQTKGKLLMLGGGWVLDCFSSSLNRVKLNRCQNAEAFLELRLE